MKSRFSSSYLEAFTLYEHVQHLNGMFPERWKSPDLLGRIKDFEGSHIQLVQEVRAAEQRMGTYALRYLPTTEPDLTSFLRDRRLARSHALLLQEHMLHAGFILPIIWDRHLYRWGSGIEVRIDEETTQGFDAVCTNKFRAYRPARWVYPVFALSAFRGDMQVFFAPIDEDPELGALGEMVDQSLVGQLPELSRTISSLVFPMVDYVSLLERSGVVRVKHASLPSEGIVFQTVTTVNVFYDHGVDRSQEGAQYKLKLGDHPCSIDRPFYMWAVVKGCSRPFFFLRVGLDSWRDPMPYA